MQSIEMLRSVAACPVCRGSLDAGWRCAGCAREFSVVDGRPALVTHPSATADVAKDNEVVRAQARARDGSSRGGLRALADRVREMVTADLFADDRTQVRALVDAVEGTLPAGLPVVDVGACEQYYRRDLERLGPVLALDVALYGATDVIADAHAMPFRDGSLGGIVVVEVLEHLRKPWKFFEEAARTLAPGGVLLGVAPQYCPTHGFPNDYFRYTRSGLGSLAENEGLAVEAIWPIGGHWGTLLHWYWANRARENALRKVPGVGVAYHAWFQGVAKAMDVLDGHAGRGNGAPTAEHQDHVGWSFVFRKR
jgi:SAM-dependent methyltransferase